MHQYRPVTYPRTMSRQRYPVRKRRFLPRTAGIERTVPHTLTLTQQVSGAINNLTPVVAQTLAFNQTAASTEFWSRPVTQTLPLTQTVAAGGLKVRSVTDTLTFTQVIEPLRIRTAAGTITFSHAATGTSSKGTAHSAALAHNIGLGLLSNKVVAQALTLAGQVVRAMVWPRSQTHALSLAHAATATRVRIRSADQLFVIAHAASRANLQQPRNTLVVAQVASVARARNHLAASAVSFTHSAARATVFNHTVSHTLPLRLGQDRLLGGQTIHVPGASGNRVQNLVLLEAPGATIVLPAPELDDGQLFSGSFGTQRSMDGETYTYIKATELNQLRYTFRLPRNKALELRRFLLGFNSAALRLTNWKGEVWRTHLVNNPFDIRSTGRSVACDGAELNEISLEFEGVKLSG